jgi:phage terminase small subunit
MKGRKPTPSPLKIIQGNPGKRAINKDEPIASVVDADTPAPDHLGTMASECWVHMVGLLSGSNVITELDLHGLELYCVSYENWRKAQQKVIELGAIVKSPKSGYPVQSRILSVRPNSNGGEWI